MLKVLFDINVLLTVLLGQSKQGDTLYLETCRALWRAAGEGLIEGWIAAFSLAIIFGQCESYYYNEHYTKIPGASRVVARKQARAKAYSDVRRCINLFKRCELVDDDVIDADDLMNTNISCNDFEDNLQLVCAYAEGIEVIVTDNVPDFVCAPSFNIIVLNPSQLHKRVFKSSL